MQTPKPVHARKCFQVTFCDSQEKAAVLFSFFIHQATLSSTPSYIIISLKTLSAAAI